MVKRFAQNTAIRDEYFRDHNFAVDLIRLFLVDSAGNPDTLNLSSGMLDLTYNGSNFSAQGEFLAYTAIQEDFDIKLGRVTITLSGLPTDYVDRFIDQEQIGKEVRIAKVFLDLDTLAIVENEPILMFIGEIYNFAILENAETCSIQIEVASLFADFERTSGRKTNNWSNWYFQKTQYDTCMEKAGYVGNTEFLWGRLE